jgi:hypothetical protein
MFTARRLIAAAVTVLAAAAITIAIASSANGRVLYPHQCPQNNPAYETR